MFEISDLASPSKDDDTPVQLPLRILLALPPYVTRDTGAPYFNVFAAIARLLGKSGSTAALDVMRPRVWAPAWDTRQLRDFMSSPFIDRPSFFAEGATEQWRAERFPAIEQASPESYDIVHITGHVESGPAGPELVTGVEAVPRLAPGALRDGLVAAKTRLLLLHASYPAMEPASDLAKMVVASGGPAVIVASARDTGTIQLYFLNVYANILHDLPLPGLAQPPFHLDSESLTVQDQPGMTGLRVHVAYAVGRENTLQLSRWKQTLDERARKLRHVILSAPGNLRAVADTEQSLHEYLHRKEIRRTQAERAAAERDLGAIDNDLKVLESTLTNIGWDHETEGAVPLAKATTAAADLQRRIDAVAALDPSALTDSAARAPRVINANFAHDDDKMLHAWEPLVAESSYALLVDVGPRWDKATSIVKGNAEFPESALPGDSTGWAVEAVLISDDFEPHVSSAWMWVPRKGGRSSPLASSPTGAPPSDASKAPDSKPGPVRLPIRAYKFAGAGEAPKAVYGRLCLYYENNLLQSAVVRAGFVSERGLKTSEPNAIDVDYVLTRGLHELDTKYATRELAFSDTEPRSRYRIALNVTVNGDGAGGHRVIVKRSADKPLSGLARFDPAAAQATLRSARDTLLDCFFERDEWGKVITDKASKSRKPGLNAQDGKSRQQFQFDLAMLAKLGNELFNKAFGQVVPESVPSANAGEWMAELRRSLASGQVIQVVRPASLPQQYVFPWALVYSYPLPGPAMQDLHFCKVVKEQWSEAGIRTGPPSRQCPHEGDADHRQNVICPYGFWGLKHIVEQPPSAVDTEDTGEGQNEIRIDGILDLAVGLTRDAQLNASAINNHVANLGKLGGVRFSPARPADDFASVREMLRAPQLAYFLCHCEADEGTESKAFLSVGPRDGNPNHRIYVNTLLDWASAENAADGFDRTAWRKRRPLVIINGCHTTQLAPGELLNFVSPFTAAGASGVVGTEVSVQLPVAIKVAELLLDRMTRPIAAGSPERATLGEAMRQMRWELANRGNLMGLAYTSYALSSLRLVP